MSEQSDFQKARSLLLHAHAQARAALEKDVKKKKGALKLKAKAQLDDLIAAQSAELFALENDGDAPAPAPQEDDRGKEVKKMKRWPEEQWSSAARSDLEAWCKERGLSKKGKKEDLIVRLTTFCHEQTRAFDSGEAIALKSDEEDQDTPVAGKSKWEESDSDDDASSDDDDQFADETSEERDARERLQKRRQVVVGRLYQILQNAQFNQLAVDELSDALAEAGVKNFRPELVGYETVEEFLREEQGKYFKYLYGPQLISLVREDQKNSKSTAKKSRGGGRGGARGGSSRGRGRGGKK